MFLDFYMRAFRCNLPNAHHRRLRLRRRLDTRFARCTGGTFACGLLARAASCLKDEKKRASPVDDGGGRLLPIERSTRSASNAKTSAMSAPHVRIASNGRQLAAFERALCVYIRASGAKL